MTPVLLPVLSCLRDRKVNDDTFDPLHAAGRMSWVDQPSPNAAPVFVVWKRTEGFEKGRLVVDLRNFNDAAISDAYPLPRRQALIAALRGSTYITVVVRVA